MGESDKIRLDPATLRWLCEQLGCDRGWRDLVTWFAKLATNAAALPPLLSDWVRACEVSKLGPAREWHADPWYEDRNEVIAADYLHSGPVMRVVLLLPTDSHPRRYEVSAEVVPASSTRPDEQFIACATPAELTAALDRLAEEVSRG